MKSIEITATEGIQSIPESDPRYSQIMEILEPKGMNRGDTYYATLGNGQQTVRTFWDSPTDNSAIEFGNHWSTPEKERRMAAILQAHLQLAHIAEEIGESKEGEERWVCVVSERDPYRHIPYNTDFCSRKIGHQFSTKEKCELYIKRSIAEGWLEVLHPLIKK